MGCPHETLGSTPARHLLASLHLQPGLSPAPHSLLSTFQPQVPKDSPPVSGIPGETRRASFSLHTHPTCTQTHIPHTHNHSQTPPPAPSQAPLGSSYGGSGVPHPALSQTRAGVRAQSPHSSCRPVLADDQRRPSDEQCRVLTSSTSPDIPYRMPGFKSRRLHFRSKLANTPGKAAECLGSSHPGGRETLKEGHPLAHGGGRGDDKLLQAWTPQPRAGTHSCVDMTDQDDSVINAQAGPGCGHRR